MSEPTERRALVGIDPEDTVRAAAQKMLAHHVGMLVVLDEDGRPIGVVTDRDLVTRCLAKEFGPEDTAVSVVMSPRVRSVAEKEDGLSALRAMADAEIRRLVVVAEDGRAVGVLAFDDLLRQVVELTEEVGRLLHGQVHA